MSTSMRRGSRTRAKTLIAPMGRHGALRPHRRRGQRFRSASPAPPPAATASAVSRHDWYLAANLSATTKPSPAICFGLSPNGVPPSLRLGSTLSLTISTASRPRSARHRRHQDGSVAQASRATFPRPRAWLADEHGIVSSSTNDDVRLHGLRRIAQDLWRRAHLQPSSAGPQQRLCRHCRAGKRDIMQAAQNSFVIDFLDRRINTVAGVHHAQCRGTRQVVGRRSLQQSHPAAHWRGLGHTTR